MVYEKIHLVGSERPRMYGLPKIHKIYDPLETILYLVGSGQHKEVKWSIDIIDHVLEVNSYYCIAGSLQFAVLVCKFKCNTNIE